MSLLDYLHGDYVHPRRVQVLQRCLAQLIPQESSVLDVGCGDGVLGSLIMSDRPDLHYMGIDVLVRKDARIPVTAFDGLHLPYPDRSWDFVMFVDVLHHTEDPMVLLREAARVSRRGLLIKDHLVDAFAAGTRLKFMDIVGNRRHGVALPFNYWRNEQWITAFRELEFSVNSWNVNLQLYPSPADWIFGRSLHFVGRLDLPESRKEAAVSRGDI